MDNNKIIKLSQLSKIHFTLEELEEMNRDMESIMRLMDAIKGVEPSPERDFWPFEPRVAVRPCPEPIPRPTIFFLCFEPFAGFKLFKPIIFPQPLYF